MNFRTLGRTGMKVSDISFGAVEIGLAYGIPVEGKIEKPSEQEAHDVLHAALDMGINFVDTARAYGDSEEVIGRALKHRRHEYILATKTLHYGDKGLSAHEQKIAVRESIESSLRALQTDVIDVMQVHNITREVVDRGDVLQVLQEAQSAGKVRFLGASVYGVDDPVAVIEDGHYDVLQVAYNMLDHRLEGKVLPLAAEKGVAITTRSVLLKGALTPRYLYLADNLAELKATV
jgi:1-deoxyxylulose-5-phosphate synthase